MVLHTHNIWMTTFSCTPDIGVGPDVWHARHVWPQMLVLMLVTDVGALVGLNSVESIREWFPRSCRARISYNGQNPGLTPVRVHTRIVCIRLTWLIPLIAFPKQKKKFPPPPKKNRDNIGTIPRQKNRLSQSKRTHTHKITKSHRPRSPSSVHKAASLANCQLKLVNISPLA